jgi:DNA-directed RNA polymerase specialized sigma24 family protein
MRQEAEFQAFYAANYGRIVAMVTAMVGDRLQAEDVAQEAFARAYSRWARIGHYEVPEAWVRQVAMRLAVDAAPPDAARDRPPPPAGGAAASRGARTG